MKPLSILQWVIFQLGGTAVQYPDKCGVCRTKAKGNIFTGFYLPCEQSHNAEYNSPPMRHIIVGIKKYSHLKLHKSYIKILFAWIKAAIEFNSLLDKFAKLGVKSQSNSKSVNSK